MRFALVALTVLSSCRQTPGVMGQVLRPDGTAAHGVDVHLLDDERVDLCPVCGEAAGFCSDPAALIHSALASPGALSTRRESTRTDAAGLFALRGPVPDGGGAVIAQDGLQFGGTYAKSPARLQLHAPVTYRLEVVDADDEEAGLAGANIVVVWLVSGVHTSVTTDESGRAALRLSREPKLFIASFPGFPSAIETDSGLEESGTVAVRPLKLSRPRTGSLRVLRDGLPIAAKVTLRGWHAENDEPNAHVVTFTTRAGPVEWPALSGARHQLELSTEDGATTAVMELELRRPRVDLTLNLPRGAGPFSGRRTCDEAACVVDEAQLQLTAAREGPAD